MCIARYSHPVAASGEAGRSRLNYTVSPHGRRLRAHHGQAVARHLPADDPVRLRGGLGSGLPCDGCDAVIASSEPEDEVEMPDGRILRFHVGCAGLWRALKQAMPKS